MTKPRSAPHSYNPEPLSDDELDTFIDNLARTIAADTKRAATAAKRRKSSDIASSRLDGELYGDFSSGRKE